MHAVAQTALRAVVHAALLLTAVPSLVACGGDDGAPQPEASSDAPSDAHAGDVASSDDVAAAATPLVPVLGPARQVVPSMRLPDGLEVGIANNNLDVAIHGGRVYLAWRTGPWHFADADVRLHVVSRPVEPINGPFEHEVTIDLDTDLREPRLLAHGDTLVMYYAVLGTSPVAFEPQGARMVERLADGTWTEPEDFYLDSFIPWRARSLDGRGHVIGYTGGGAIYTGDDAELEVHWLTTEDGRTFESAVEGGPVVLEGGASETDFAVLSDGTVVAVSRLEKGDDRGYGSLVCRAEADAQAQWGCVVDPKKYDSPLVMNVDDQVFLVGRRNLTETGYYDLHWGDAPPEGQSDDERYIAYQLAYSDSPKRCAIWRVHEDTLEVEHLLDLPSRGDTCFASAIPKPGGGYWLYNYSNDLEGPDHTWQDGQFEPTYVHRFALDFEPEAAAAR